MSEGHRGELQRARRQLCMGTPSRTRNDECGSRFAHFPGKDSSGREASDASTDRFCRHQGRNMRATGRQEQDGNLRRRRALANWESARTSLDHRGAEWPVVPRKPSNLGGGKGLSSRGAHGRRNGHGDWRGPHAPHRVQELRTALQAECATAHFTCKALGSQEVWTTTSALPRSRSLAAASMQ